MGSAFSASLSSQEMRRYLELTDHKFSKGQIRQMYRLFSKHAVEGKLFLEGFMDYLDELAVSVVGGRSKADSKATGEQLFRGYDIDGDGVVSFDDYLAYTEAVMYNSPKLCDVVFAIYDANKDGYLTPDDLLAVVTNSSLSFSEDTDHSDLMVIIEYEIAKLWQFLDPGDVGQVDKDALRRAAVAFPQLLPKLCDLA
eukprot:Sspe_Gene.77966::Locus_48750_Transcript_1_1_Confidence_1.000_Length_664::g.77966::m.77966